MAINISAGKEKARFRTPLLRLPLVLALLAQCLSAVIVLPALTALSVVGSVNVPVFVALLLQGGCAAGVSRLFRLAPWWLAMQCVLPLALLMAWALHWPSGIYLAAFLFFLMLYWTTFRTQVPFYPSGPRVWAEVVQLLPAERPIRFIDIGSGFGGMVLHVARHRADCAVTGIEVAPLPWVTSRLRAVFGGSRGRFVRGDYNRLDFGDFDVVFAYLSPAAMPALWAKAGAEMRPGSLLLSYEFAIPGVQSQIVHISAQDDAILYGWNI